MDPLARGGEREGAEEGAPRPPAYYRGFVDAERRRKVVNAEVSPGQAVVGALLAALPISLFILIVSRLRAGGGGGRRKASGEDGFWESARAAVTRAVDPLPARDFRVDVGRAGFGDVVGLPEAVEAVRPFVEFLREPARLSRLGGRLPRGCLLTGPPGTGKTLLARAVAGEAGAPFFAAVGADFIEVYAGSGPRRVRELFAAARASAPSVVFIDEIDAVGARAGVGGPLGLAGEERRTVNQLLAELDGLPTAAAVAVFAATNFEARLDPALLRAGRFDRKIPLEMPDRGERVALFEHYLAKVVVEGGAGDAGRAAAARMAERLAGLATGASPAAIAAIVNEAALRAAVGDRPAVGLVDLLPAVDDVLIGKRHRSRRTADAERRVAVYESARALLAWILPTQSEVVKVSITPRGMSATGFTQQLGRERFDLTTERSMFTDLCVRLAGRLAEEVLYHDLTTTAEQDFQHATRLAVEAFLSFGTSPQNVGLLAFDPQHLHDGRSFQKHSEEMQRLAEAEAVRLIAAASEFTRALLLRHKDAFLRLSTELFEKKELLREDIENILGPRPPEEELASETQAAIARFSAASEKAALSRRQTIEGLYANSDDEITTVML